MSTDEQPAPRRVAFGVEASVFLEAFVVGRKTVMRSPVMWKFREPDETQNHEGASAWVPSDRRHLRHTHSDGNVCNLIVQRMPCLPGDVIDVLEPLWVSECGLYVARKTHIPHEVMHDVIERSTGKEWLVDRWHPTGEESHLHDRRFTHPHAPGVVSSWSCGDGRNVAFSQGWCDTDVNIPWRKAGGGTVGNSDAILKTYEAKFTRRMRASSMSPRFVRVKLRVQSMRAERLHAITDDECVAEGITEKVYVKPIFTADDRKHHRLVSVPKTLRQKYATLWDMNHASAPWSTNPWVYRIETELLQGGVKP